MRGDFPDDTFTQTDVEIELDRAGLRWTDKGRYLLSQCPTHDDVHPSVQIYKDDWFVNCHATCGRFHITKAFPTLRPTQEARHRNSGVHPSKPARFSEAKKVTEHKYKTFDLIETWQALPMIPRDHNFKGIPLEVLDNLGWRFVPDYNQYFIPYFSASKQSIPFAQYRNLANDGPRFIMLKDAKPTCYGTWNLDNKKLFVVEGTSDCAVLEYAGVPWIGLPSAASTALMASMADYCRKNAIELIYAGDNDAAGEKLREALDEVTSYRVKQPPKEYKDWGDFLVGAGIEVLGEFCMEELFGKPIEDAVPEEIAAVFPGAEEVNLDVPDFGGVGSQESKEQSGEPKPTVLF